MLITEALTREEIIQGLEAIIKQNYNSWRMTFPPKKRFPDYEILMAVMDMLTEEGERKWFLKR